MSADNERNRKIAEHLEPCPKLPEVFGPSREVSPLGFWVMEWVPRRDPNPFKWVPRNDFFTDPAMRDLLQQKLLEEGWIIGLYPLKSGLVRADFTDREVTHGFEVTDTRDRIWPLAYLRAHNLSAGEVK